MSKGKYYEALDKNNKIYRFFAKNNYDAISIVIATHCKSLIRISYNNLRFLDTILTYKDTGY